MNFADLGLNTQLLSTLQALGYEQATLVQQQAIPAALLGGDMLVSSHTGSGKTAAFLLPALQRMIDTPKPKSHAARLLVLTPTRELAQQIEKAARNYGREVRRLNTACLVGGSSYYLQLKDLGRQPEILIATPGRLLDHIERGRVDLSQIETLVLDEADRMLDMGFSDDIEAIVAQTNPERQTLLFSATMEGVVGSLARKLTRDPQRIEIEKKPEQEAKIEQRLMMVDDLAHKNRLLGALLRDESMKQAVVFTATKRGAEDLSNSLRDEGFLVEALHGDMHQNLRNRTLTKLRQGRIGILVATDVAARGIDVAGISHVINFDPPRQVEDYVHRIGRTGRAGRTGTAVTLAEFKERRIIRDIERYTGQTIELHTIPGMEPTRREERPRDGAPKRRYGKSSSGGGGGRFKSGGYGGGGGGYGGGNSRPRSDSDSPVARERSEQAREHQLRERGTGDQRPRTNDGFAPRRERPAGEGFAKPRDFGSRDGGSRDGGSNGGGRDAYAARGERSDRPARSSFSDSRNDGRRDDRGGGERKRFNDTARPPRKRAAFGQ